MISDNNNVIGKYDNDLFITVYDNDSKKVREMIDCGCDINMTEYDKGTTPIHIACARGHKQVLELLVQRGCDVNVQDNRCWTPLHSLVTGRYDILALWLIKQGSLIDIKDKNGFSAFDMAQRWFQKEMIDVSMGKLSNSENELIEFNKEIQEKQIEYNNNIKVILQQHEKSKYNTIKRNDIYPDQASICETPIGNQVIGCEVIKIYYHEDSYKSVKVSSYDNTTSIIKLMCEKINMTQYNKCFDLVEVLKNQVRFLNPNEFILASKSKWPVIISTSTSNFNDSICHFALVLRKTAPNSAHYLFNYINK